MHLQKVQNPPLKGLRGLLVVVGLVGFLVVLSYVLAFLSQWIGATAGTLGLWGCGAVVVIWTMRRFVMGYSFAMNDSLLRMSHTYGKYERLIEDVYFSKVLAAGAPEALAERFPDVRPQRYLLKTCTVAPFAFAYSDDGKTRVAVIQADEKIRERLTRAAADSRKK